MPDQKLSEQNNLLEGGLVSSFQCCTFKTRSAWYTESSAVDSTCRTVVGKGYSQTNDFGVVQLTIYTTREFTAIVEIEYKALRISCWAFKPPYYTSQCTM